MPKIRLTPKVSEALCDLLPRGVSLARVTKKAQVLRLVASGYSITKAATLAGVCRDTAGTVCSRCAEGGLEYALYDKACPGHVWLLSNAQEAKNCCNGLQPSPTRPRDLDDTCHYEGGYQENYGQNREQDNDFSTSSKQCSQAVGGKMGCVPDRNDEYLGRMEDVLQT